MSSPTKSKSKRSKSSVVRRSFVLPARLVERVGEAAPPEYGDNLNAAVRHALEEFVRRKDDEEFARDYPSNVRVGRTETGLPKDTLFLCFQARAIDPARLRDPTTGAPRRIGTMPAARMAEFDTALRRVLAL